MFNVLFYYALGKNAKMYISVQISDNNKNTLRKYGLVNVSKTAKLSNIFDELSSGMNEL